MDQFKTKEERKIEFGSRQQKLKKGTEKENSKLKKAAQSRNSTGLSESNEKTKSNNI